MLHDTLPTVHERGNPYDRYAIAARKCLSGYLVEVIVGHLSKEILRVIRYIMLHSATVAVKVLDTHHHRSSLVQGGLKISIQVLVKMDYSPQNKDSYSSTRPSLNSTTENQ